MPRRDDYEHTQAELDRRADQLNSNNYDYWESRGYDERPDDWEDRSEYESPEEH